jgi:hypothetical protein
MEGRYCLDLSELALVAGPFRDSPRCLPSGFSPDSTGHRGCRRGIRSRVHDGMFSGKKGATEDRILVCEQEELLQRYTRTEHLNASQLSSPAISQLVT